MHLRLPLSPREAFNPLPPPRATLSLRRADIPASPHTGRERAILVGLAWKGRAAPVEPEESLKELEDLARSAGAVITDRVFQARESPEAATLIGRGKVRELAALAASGHADVVLFDHDLTPTQQRNLEDELSVRVLDRTQLILDIFASRARTREGRLQVELAQLNYLLPRLTGRGAAMSRLGGGIGTRGPGETQLETDRRRIARRIRAIREDLENVRMGRKVHRQQRTSIPLPTLALAGYTNAGKSTLFNRLTRAQVTADARMFATLDPTVRSLTLPSRRKVLLSDTVGFIRNLPTTLIKAFRATLEEIAEASLILQVVDFSSPHAAARTGHVLRVLSDIGAGEIPQLLVLNKMDAVGEGARPETLEKLANAESVAVSALTGAGIDELLAAIDEVLPFDPVVRVRFKVPLTEGGSIALLHELGRVAQSRYTDQYCEIEADVPDSVKRRLAGFVQ